MAEKKAIKSAVEAKKSTAKKPAAKKTATKKVTQPAARRHSCSRRPCPRGGDCRAPWHQSGAGARSLAVLAAAGTGDGCAAKGALYPPSDAQGN